MFIPGCKVQKFVCETDLDLTSRKSVIFYVFQASGVKHEASAECESCATGGARKN